MHKLEIKERNIEVYAPENWEEMTQAQFLKVLELILALEEKLINLTDFKLQVALVLFGIYKTKKLKASFSEKEEIYANLFILSELFDYILETKKGKKGKPTVQLNFTSYNQFLPTINKFVGPKNGLTNLSWNQFTKAVTFYQKYIKTKDEKHLTALIAALYLPEDSTFEETDINDRIADFESLPPNVKFAVFLFFRNNLMFIQNANININGEEINLGILFQKDKKKAKSDGLGLVGLQMAVAESGIFGAMEEVGKQNIYDIYAYLYKNKFAYLETLKNTK